MRLIAHRGFLSVNPENTVAAVEAAAAVADGIEIDVRRCGSGEPVVIHDETVDRVTDGRGAVDEHTVADLAALDVLEPGPASRRSRRSCARFPTTSASTSNSRKPEWRPTSSG